MCGSACAQGVPTRTIRAAELLKFGETLQATIAAGDSIGYLALFALQSPEIAAVRNSVEGRRDLYCVLFNTQCLREALGKIAKDGSDMVNARMSLRTRTIVSLGEMLSDIRVRSKYSATVGTDEDDNDLSHGVVVWNIVPEDYGWMVRPEAKVVYVRGGWRLASTFALVPQDVRSDALESWSVKQFMAAENIREERFSGLNHLATDLRRAIAEGEAAAILSLCGNSGVSVGEDQSMSCGELTQKLRDHSSTLYCEIFDTRCYRSNLEAFAKDPKNNAPDMFGLSKQVVSVRDVLLKAGAKLNVEVSFDRPNGEEDLSVAVITFETPEPPQTYGALNYPYVRVVYQKDKWVLSSLIPAL